MKVERKGYYCEVTVSDTEYEKDQIKALIEASNAATAVLHSPAGVNYARSRETDDGFTIVFHKACDCQFCKAHQIIRHAITNRDTDKLIELVNQLSDLNCEIGSDLDYYKCIMNGSWHSSVEILEEALGKAKQLATQS